MRFPRYGLCLVRMKEGRVVRWLAAAIAGAALGAAAGALPAGAQAGARALIAECAACHGEEGIARDVEVPNLAGQREAYLYRQLVAFQTKKRKHKEMRTMSRQMDEADMRAIAQYYSSLPPR